MNTISAKTNVLIEYGLSKLECNFFGMEKGDIALELERFERHSISNNEWMSVGKVSTIIPYDQALYLAERIIEAVNNCKKEDSLCQTSE